MKLIVSQNLVKKQNFIITLVIIGELKEDGKVESKNYLNVILKKSLKFNKLSSEDKRALKWLEKYYHVLSGSVVIA